MIAALLDIYFTVHFLQPAAFSSKIVFRLHLYQFHQLTVCINYFLHFEVELLSFEVGEDSMHDMRASSTSIEHAAWSTVHAFRKFIIVTPDINSCAGLNDSLHCVAVSTIWLNNL